MKGIQKIKYIHMDKPNYSTKLSILHYTNICDI